MKKEKKEKTTPKQQQQQKKYLLLLVQLFQESSYKQAWKSTRMSKLEGLQLSLVFFMIKGTENFL